MTPRRSRIAAATLLAGAASALCGCNEALFPARETRTQYDVYDRSRNQHAPQYVTDPYGRREPNLRGRLEPKER